MAKPDIFSEHLTTDQIRSSINAANALYGLSVSNAILNGGQQLPENLVARNSILLGLADDIIKDRNDLVDLGYPFPLAQAIVISKFPRSNHL